MSLLFEAVKNNDLKALKRALKESCSPDDLAGALRNASELGRIKLVRYLLKAGAHDDWAIVAAASFASDVVVRLLYQNGGGNLNAALIGAAAHGQVKNVLFLLETPADSLNEALADAALRGYLETVRVLLNKGADPFAPVYGGQTAVDLALKRGHRKIADLILSRARKN